MEPPAPEHQNYDWRAAIPAVVAVCSAVGAWIRSRRKNSIKPHLGLYEQLQEREENRARLLREVQAEEAEIQALKTRIFEGAAMKSIERPR